MITGASGLLGSKLVKLAIQAGYEVHSFYNTHPLTEGNPQRVDLTDEAHASEMIFKKSPHAVVHAASLTDVDFCEQNPDLAMWVNGLATGTLARACRKIGSFLVYVSTDYVFDGTKGHYTEDDEPNPINAYGRSKLEGEQQIIQHGKDFCIARTSVVYGWGREHRQNFATWIYERLRAQRSIKVVVDQHVSPTLNSGLARMLLEVVERGIGGVIHLAGATRTSRYEFALRVCRRFRFDEKLLAPVRSDSIDWKAKRPRDSSLRVDNALKMLKNRPAAIDDALDEFVREAPVS